MVFNKKDFVIKSALKRNILPDEGTRMKLSLLVKIYSTFLLNYLIVGMSVIFFITKKGWPAESRIIKTIMYTIYTNKSKWNTYSQPQYAHESWNTFHSNIQSLFTFVMCIPQIYKPGSRIFLGDDLTEAVDAEGRPQAPTQFHQAGTVFRRPHDDTSPLKHSSIQRTMLNEDDAFIVVHGVSERELEVK